MAAQPVTMRSSVEYGVDNKTIAGMTRASSDSLTSNNISNDTKFQENPFLDPDVATHYRGLYEKAQYECRHVFDPSLEWTPAEEKAIVRKLDWRVSLWACVAFAALNIDRKNIAQAVSDNMLDDLGLTTNSYNYGNTIFLVSFLLAEIPSQLVSKKFGPDRWIPTQMVLWSIVAASQAAITGQTSFYVTRSLLGILEVCYAMLCYAMLKCPGLLPPPLLARPPFRLDT